MSPKKPQFKSLGLIPKDQLPQRSRASIINSLPIWEDLQKIAEDVREHGAWPYEAYATIEVKKYPSLKDLKRPMTSLLSKIRQFLRKNKIEGKLELISRKDEQTIYIGGAE